MVKAIYLKVNQIDAKFEAQQQKITKLEKEVKDLNAKVFSLQNSVNQHEQEKRSLSLRINGLAFYPDEKADPSVLAKRVFDRVLQPILVQAKANDKIAKVPSLSGTISDCYRVRGHSALTGTGSPPPVVVKLHTEQVRLAILQSKRRATPPPLDVEKDWGIQRISIMEDLTPQCYKTLRDLKRLETVDRAWTTSGRIRFTLTGSERVHLVKSVYEDANDIVNKVLSTA